MHLATSEAQCVAGGAPTLQADLARGLRLAEIRPAMRSAGLTQLAKAVALQSSQEAPVLLIHAVHLHPVAGSTSSPWAARCGSARAWTTFL